MIVTGDVENILFEDCQKFGIPVFRKDAIPQGKVEDRIAILTKAQKDGTYWKKGFVEVNFCAPDIEVNTVRMADKKRLLELERLGNTLESTGRHNGTSYMYSVYEISQEKDTELGCHFVNVRLLFQVLNVK